MAEERKQQPQQAQDAQRAELAELMQLSLGEIAELPEDKQQLVYAEMGRQLAEDTELSEKLADMVAGIERVMNGTREQAATIQALLRRWDEGQKEWQRRWEALQRQYDFSKLAETM